MRRTRIAQESFLDGMGISIDSRLKSSQSFLSPIVPAVSVAVYLRSEDCGSQSVDKGEFTVLRIGWTRVLRGISSKQPITPEND